MSSSALETQYSKSRVPITPTGLALIGVALICVAVIGFVYAFWPGSTNTSEIDLGIQLQKLSIPPRVYFFEPQTQTVPQIINASVQQEPTPEGPLILKSICKTRGLPTSINEGTTTLNIPLTCDGKPVDPRRIKAQWTIDAGVLTVKGPTSLLVDTKDLLGKTLTITGDVIGCGKTPCSVEFRMLVVEPVANITVDVRANSGEVISGAAVTLANYGTMYTDANGRVEFHELKNGSYSISVVAKGFLTYNTTQQLSGSNLRVRASLVGETPPNSPSPTENPSPSPPASPSLEASPSANASAATPTPKVISGPRQLFAPGENGKLKISWPRTVSTGWPNVCEIRYEPPVGGLLPDGYNVQASFFLTSTNGLVNSNLTSPFQPFDQNTHTWSIPLEPNGVDGLVVKAQLMMSVKIGDESAKTLDVGSLQSTIDEPALTRNQTLGGSGISAVFGFGLLGLSIIRKSRLALQTSPAAEIEDRRAAAVRFFFAPAAHCISKYVPVGGSGSVNVKRLGPLVSRSQRLGRDWHRESDDWCFCGCLCASGA